MNVLLSIKPKYADSTISGQKKYEFRKVVFKKNHINFVYIYSSSPVKRIVGAFRIGDIIEDRPSVLWERLSEFSGLSEQEFFKYFENSDKGFAIEIRNLERFDNPVDPTELFPDFRPPQSFCYVNFSFTQRGFKSEGKNTNLQDY